MKPSGLHIVAEFLLCSEDILNNKDALEELLKLGIDKYGLHLETIASHKFHPIGVTAIAIISESHIAIHTYPEAHHASIDIFTCSAESQPATDLLGFFRAKLKPKKVQVTELLRGFTLETKQENWITSSTGDGGYEVKYHAEKRILTKRTKYQLIEIIEHESFGRMLFLDNDLQIAEADAPIYNRSLITPLVESRNGLNNIAILGGGDGGVLHELQKHNLQNLVLVDIDEEVINASKRHLRGICGDAFDQPNVKIMIMDANDFLESSNGFDAIVYDLTMHPEFVTTMDRMTYLTGLFKKIRRSLNDRGMISLQCCSEFDTDTLDLVMGMLEKDYTDITVRKAFIPSFCENWVFVSATAV
jgi:S-adenosylmethionine decarboxylase proenzyme